jgi:hypothetical protein
VVDPEIGEEECDLSGRLYDCEKAIYGAIFLEAARILGNTVKESVIKRLWHFFLSCCALRKASNFG